MPRPQKNTSATKGNLKAVNPRARNERDTRMPCEILDSIAAHGAQVEQALGQLRQQLMMVGRAR
jgi:hypothetical protein